MTTPATPSTGKPHQVGHVIVLDPDQLDRTNLLPIGARIVVDATAIDPPSLPVLARAVLLRRRLRATGGDLILAVSAAAAETLRTSGLHWAVPCRNDVDAAVAALTDAHTDPPRG